MFEERINHSYYDSNGNPSNLYKGFSEAVNKRFGNEGTHSHLREDVKLEKLVNTTKNLYNGNPHLNFMKSYFSCALGFIEKSWETPCSSCHKDFSPIGL